MNKRLKKQISSYLLDEIGNIDDRFVAEALTWKAEKRAPRRNPIRVLLIAASLALVLTVGIAGTVTMLRRNGQNLPTGDQITEQPDQVTPVERFDSVLFSALQSPSFTVCSAEEVSFFDGNVRLAVKDRQTGALYVSRPLTQGEQAELSRSLNASVFSVASGADNGDYLVWITLGDGWVLSPCLFLAGGNLAAATLFDYEAECIPSQDFNVFLASLS